MFLFCPRISHLMLTCHRRSLRRITQTTLTLRRRSCCYPRRSSWISTLDSGVMQTRIMWRQSAQLWQALPKFHTGCMVSSSFWDGTRRWLYSSTHSTLLYYWACWEPREYSLLIVTFPTLIDIFSYAIVQLNLVGPLFAVGRTVTGEVCTRLHWSGSVSDYLV